MEELKIASDGKGAATGDLRRSNACASLTEPHATARKILESAEMLSECATNHFRRSIVDALCVNLYGGNGIAVLVLRQRSQPEFRDGLQVCNKLSFELMAHLLIRRS